MNKILSDLSVPPGFEKELNNIAIDFDGVLHNFDKGFHDGTCYGKPIEGSIESVKLLSKKWNIIIFTAKAKPNRPLINGKTGEELVWEWLEEHDMAQFVTKVTAEKPRAVQYIDDKSVKFTDWVRYWEEDSI